ncbi:MAG: hypothetical protein A2020_00070 [Lentisphaerae bacterium GWF2_45_14]|nr:MAG: hypothetical protein A2020_00070 [Lentisphaerae bacterium GWF2_45_14]
MSKAFIIILFVLLGSSEAFQAAAQDSEEYEGKERFELSESEKKKYQDDATYQTMAMDPVLFSQKDKCKRSFKAVYQSYSRVLPTIYKNILPKSFGIVQIENIDAKLPLFFPTSKNKLLDEIASISGPRLVTIYATINSKVMRKSGVAVPLDKKVKPEEKFYLIIDDIDYEDVKCIGNNTKFDVSEYLQIKYLRLDIQAYKFVDKKVRFDITFRDISNLIHPIIIKYAGLTPDDFFILTPTEKLNVQILISRNNEFCVEPISNSKTGSKLNICGTLKYVKEETKGLSFNIYYILVDGINENIE